MSKKSTARIRRIVAVCHDLGGAQAILPVVRNLKHRRDIRVDVVAGSFAIKLFTRFRPEIARVDWSDQEIDGFLQKSRPDLLLSSTSWKSRLEQGFRNRANELGIPSVVVIDFWSNYRLRWQHATYQFEEGKDHVCVMDNRTARVMRNEGYPKAKLYVTGQPYLEHCPREKAGHARNQQRGTKRQTNVLLLSISLAGLGLKDDPMAPIRVVCQALGRWHETTDRPIKLSIRRHPHENADPDFLHKVHQIVPRGVTVRLADRTKPLSGQILNNDLILGYVTMALFEARCLGKNSIAIQVAKYSNELRLAMQEAGIILLPLNAERIASYLLSSAARAPNNLPIVHRGATAAIAKICRNLIRTKK
ncbi:MAG: hypothetical protein JOZ08_15055 [Verrucomicrobia bacterium]|nr:hypothetical protein [Verrucomicrobiota bacterium]MBV8277409.1 hypothetical protein [Verrucomicrobiota bacterium]